MRILGFYVHMHAGMMKIQQKVDDKQTYNVRKKYILD